MGDEQVPVTQNENEKHPENSRDKKRTPVVKPYNFASPPCFSEENYIFLNAVHAVFARETGHRLKFLPGAEIEVRLQPLEQLVFPGFLKTLSPPAVIFVLKLNPAELLFFNIEAAGALRLIDVALGGNGDAERDKLTLTGIEEQIMSAIVKNAVLPALATTWKPCLETCPQILYFENNPANLRTLLEEMCLIIPLKMEVNGHITRLNLCYPYSMLEPLMTLLSKQFSREREWGTERWRSGWQNSLFLQQYVEFSLENLSVTLGDIRNWKNPATLSLPAAMTGTTKAVPIPPEGVYYD